MCRVDNVYVLENAEPWESKALYLCSLFIPTIIIMYYGFLGRLLRKFENCQKLEVVLCDFFLPKIEEKGL